MGEVTAAILAIGDELLSGRTRDINIHHLANWLTERGVALREARIVSDDEENIATALNALRQSYDYVFTSGGIGPTHDDITVDAVARAFCVDVVVHPGALQKIEAWYAKLGQEITPARKRMARMPAGAHLIENPETGAPGVMIDNVFVMAGVPRIFAAMLEAVAPQIRSGARMHSRAVTASGLPESALADDLRRIQGQLVGVTLGSYPIDGDEKGVSIVARSLMPDAAAEAINQVSQAIVAIGGKPRHGDHADARNVLQE